VRAKFKAALDTDIKCKCSPLGISFKPVNTTDASLAVCNKANTSQGYVE